MKPEDYAWNAHERKSYENDQVILPSPYKLKIKLRMLINVSRQ